MKKKSYSKQCPDCLEYFEAANYGKIYCGSTKEKTGCSQRRKLEYDRTFEPKRLIRVPNYKTETIELT